MGPPPTSPAGSAPAPHWRALDGLRALAVLAVMAYHLGHLSGGFLGVDLFFVLSGFLITSLLLGEGQRRGRVDLKRFWVRRARRLLPALAAALVAVVVAARVWLDHSTLPALRIDALATAGYVANWRFATQAAGGYFAADPSPLRHTWSLAIEEQYYLVWPLVVVAAMALARRRSGRPALVVGVVAGVGALASATWMAIHAEVWSTDRLYLGTDTRLVAPLSGALLACLLQGRTSSPSRRVRGAATLIGAAGVLGLAVASVTVSADAEWMYRGGFTLMAVLAAAAVAGGVLGGDRGLEAALGARPLTWVGERSYGLYLYSWPIQIILAAQGLEGAGLAAATVALSFAVAALSHRYLEMPIRREGLRGVLPARLRPEPAGRSAAAAPAPSRAGARTTGAVVGLSAVAVLLVVVAATVTSARPDPLAALGQDELEEGASRPPVTTSPSDVGDDGASRVLVVGDSVAYTIGRYAPEAIPGVASVDNRGLPGCGLLVEGARPPEAVAAGSPSDYEGCAGPVADADGLGLEGDPDVVLLVTGAWESSEHERGGRTVGPGDEGWTDEVRDLLDERVTTLSADGAVVALWADPCGPESSDRERQRWFTEEVLDPVDAAREEAVVVRPAEVACRDGAARTDVEGVGDPRPDDGQHWSEDGAGWLWTEWLGPTLHDLASTGPAPGGAEGSTGEALPPDQVPPATTPPAPPAQPTRTLVVGDSVAFTLAWEGRAGARASGVDLEKSRGAIGCGLVREGTSADGARDLAETCGPITELEDDSVQADPEVVVAMWGAWEVAGADDLPDVDRGRPGDAGYTAYVRERLRERLVALGSTGSAVAVLGIDCWPPNEVRRTDRLRWWRDLSRSVAEDVGAAYLDPTDELCVDGEPRNDIAGVGNPRPTDGAHWTREGADWFWQAWLGPQVHRLAGDAS